MIRNWRIGALIAGVIALGLVLFLTLRGLLLPPLTPENSTTVPRQTPTSSGAGLQPQAKSTPSPTPTPTPVNTTPVQISSDPYSGDGSQHRTEVEPSTFSYGATIVAAFQAGRFRDVGSTNIGWATSPDGGIDWEHGFLPDTTKVTGGPFDRITDPVVAYDAAHDTWMIGTVAFVQSANGIAAPAVLVSRSVNGGLSWERPVTVANVGNQGGLDKDWLVCDNTSTSPFYGTCYMEWDDYSRNDLIQMSTSKDGGQTWSAAKTTANQASGTSGYPLVQPNGTVIVPISSGDERDLMVFTSHDGGNSWSSPTVITAVTSFASNAYFRDNVLLTPASDGSGKAYLVWVDCRFEPNCRGNDLVMTTSTDGVNWSPIRRIPLALVGSGINYYVSWLAIDSSTENATAHLALLFYYYAANCSSNCMLSVGFSYSTDGGSTWSVRKTLAGPFPAAWIASGNNKVGDYTAMSFVQGKAVPVFSSATQPGIGYLNEATYTIPGGINLQ
jgi:BNR repeat-like domain